jgi:hypothetical protein
MWTELCAPVVGRLASFTQLKVKNVNKSNSHSPTDVFNAATAVTWQGHTTNGVGTTYGAEPMATLTATPDQISVECPLGDFTLPKGSVIRITRGRLYPWMFGGLRFVHNMGGVPDELQFKPSETSSKSILERLRELGYPA